MVKIAAAHIRAAARLSTAILCEQYDSSDRKREKKAKDQERSTTAQFEGFEGYGPSKSHRYIYGPQRPLV